MPVQNVFIKNQLKPHVAGYFALGEQPRGLIKWIVDKFKPITVLDVGSGPFGSKKIFNQYGCRYVWCIDGDDQLLYREDLKDQLETFCVVDLERSPYRFPTRFDIVYSYECAEHIAAVDNYVSTLVENCENYIIMTAALPGSGGHNHVNEQKPDYWIAKITARGFRYLENETAEGKATGDGYFGRSGLVFQRKK